MPTVGRLAVLDRAFERIEGELTRWQVPGLELAVVRLDELDYAAGFGHLGVGDPTPVTADTLFEHGSCGKAFTGLLGAAAAQAGLLDLDAPVRRYVPELRLPDPYLADRVSTRDLLAHRSGLSRHDLVWILAPGRSREELVRRLEHLPLAADLRAQWHYSNLGYTLAGLAIGRAVGTSWESALAELVLGPFGMTRTNSPAAADGEQALPHLLRDGTAVPVARRPLLGAAPAGQLRSCGSDSLRWLRAQLGAGPLAAAVRDSQRLVTPVPAGLSPFPELDFAGYGLGWLEGRYRGHRLVWHNGGIDGFATQTLLLPEAGIGVLASANQHLTNFPLAVVLQVADDLLATPDGAESWFDRLHPDREPAVPAQPGRPPAPRPPVHELAAYAGTYTDPGYGELVVSVAADGLRVRLAETELTARHRHLDTWDLRYDVLELDLPVSFTTDPEGAVTEAVVATDPSTAPTRFRRG